MTAQSQSVPHISGQKKGKPGELTLMLGLVCLVVAPFFLFMLNMNDEKYAALKTTGVVAEAMIKNKSVDTESYTTSKGRQKTRKVYRLDVEFDFNAPTRYVDWKASGSMAPSPNKAITSTILDVGSSYHDKLAVGAKTTVIRNPIDYKSLMLVDQLETETSFAYHLKWYLGMGALALAGLGMTVMGARKRFARA
jgi:hypothetical protein